MNFLPAFLAPVLVAATAACGSPPPVRQGDDRVTDQGASMSRPDCLERITVDQAVSVLSEQRRVGPPVADFQTRFRAEYLDPAAQVPVEVVRAYQIGRTPLLWFDVTKTEAVVNAAVLSDLVVADVTAIRAGEQVEIGQLGELGIGQLGGRELVKFLIAARVIATYVHIGAELCLVEEHDTQAAGYRARFTGEHTYFTSSKNTKTFAFSVAIDATGAITVRGE